MPLFRGERGFLCRFLLSAGWDFSVRLCGHPLERFQRACGNTDALSFQTYGLEVHVLFTLGRDVGVTARVANVGALASQGVDTGHRIARRIDEGADFGKRATMRHDRAHESSRNPRFQPPPVFSHDRRAPARPLAT